MWAAWTGVALLFSLQSMLPSTAVGSLTEWQRAAVWQVMGWWSWAALTPLVVFVARRGTALEQSQ